uniref:Chitin-binding type-2 domain-containing protein n=1 Tax=Megaselia scalaris TaxID=36166 RepID=T1GTZ1_MEGSC
YYADDTVGCEVFHYCQDNQRHSWVCPEGFTFHQVHLICMPPSHDNICEQSQKYHVVNNYLYKPINLEEHQSKPNVSLRYSERYFPEDIYEDQRYQYESRQDRERAQHHHQRQPVQVGFQHAQPQQPQPQQQIHQVQQPQRVTQPTRHNLVTNHPQQHQTHQQVFRSPEEINISLQQRRPQIFIATSTPRYYEDEYSYERRK